MANAYANSLAFTNYGYASTLDNKNGGWQINPANSVEYLVINKANPYVIHLCAPTTFTLTGIGSVTINSIIEVLPTALNLKSKFYACDSGSAALITLGF